MYIFKYFVKNNVQIFNPDDRHKYENINIKDEKLENLFKKGLEEIEQLIIENPYFMSQVSIYSRLIFNFSLHQHYLFNFFFII